GPGVTVLVFFEGGKGADQQTGIARGAKAHVDVVELPGNGLGTEDVDDLLAEAHEEGGVVDLPLPVGAAGRVCPMNEDQIQVGAVAQLDAAELAIADDDEVPLVRRHRVATAVGTAGSAVAG